MVPVKARSRVVKPTARPRRRSPQTLTNSPIAPAKVKRRPIERGATRVVAMTTETQVVSDRLVDRAAAAVAGAAKRRPRRLRAKPASALPTKIWPRPKRRHARSSSGTGAGSGRTKSAKSKVPSHRNIPAWEEAVGFIVDSNLQSRDQRRRSSPRNSGRGRPAWSAEEKKLMELPRQNSSQLSWCR